MKRRRKNKRAPSLPLPWERRRGTWQALFEKRRLTATFGLVFFLVTTYALGTLAAKDANVRHTRAKITAAHHAMAAFRLREGRCPRSLDELMRGPSGEQYLHRAPTDAWGKPLRIECPHPVYPQDQLIFSAGPDGKFGTDDNVY